MARRGGLAEDLLAIGAKLPWWAGLLLATCSYLGFRELGQIDVPLVTHAAESGPMVIRSAVKIIAPVLQYLVPALLLIGVLAGALRGASARRRLPNSTQPQGKSKPKSAPDSRSQPNGIDQTPAGRQVRHETATPPCPKCSAPMVIRTANSGQRAGEQFLGCSRFPECRGTRAIVAP